MAAPNVAIRAPAPRLAVLVCAGGILGLLGCSMPAAEPAPVSTASASTAQLAAVGTEDPAPLEGGLSDQALAAVRDSPLASTVVDFYRPFETGDTSVYDRLLSEDFDDLPPSPGQGPGRAGMVEHVRDDIVATFPDARIRLEQIVVAGDTVVVRGLFTGTPAGLFLGVDPAGREASYRTVDIHTVEGGQIVRTHHIEDFYGAMQQLTS